MKTNRHGNREPEYGEEMRPEEFNALCSVAESPQVNKIEAAIFNCSTFRVLINQSGNDALLCARDIARCVAKVLSE